MAKRIITISREFGSGGRFIGEEVAKKLGIAYYDKDIIGQIAEKSGFSTEYIKENAVSPKKGLFGYAFAGRDLTGKSVEDMVYEAQRKVILEIAEKESLRHYRKKCRFYFEGQRGCAECIYTRRYAGKSAAHLQTVPCQRRRGS